MINNLVCDYESQGDAASLSRQCYLLKFWKERMHKLSHDSIEKYQIKARKLKQNLGD